MMHAIILNCLRKEKTGRTCIQMKMRRHAADLLNCNLGAGIFLFAMPVAFSSILQQVFNSADTAVAGRKEWRIFSGDLPQAASQQENINQIKDKAYNSGYQDKAGVLYVR